MAPHALRQFLCTDAVPIGAGGRTARSFLSAVRSAAEVVAVAAGRGSRVAGFSS